MAVREGNIFTIVLYLGTELPVTTTWGECERDSECETRREREIEREIDSSSRKTYLRAVSILTVDGIVPFMRLFDSLIPVS